MVSLKLAAALFVISVLTETQGAEVESRLLGSKDSEKHSHTYHVAFFRHNRWLGGEEFVGSGALLSNEWIITSGHVARKVDSWRFIYSTKVKAGMDRLESEPVQAADIQDIVYHDFFNSNMIADNDIALVRVKEPGFILNEAISKVLRASDEPSQTQVVVTGWHAAGKYKKPLQELSMDIKDRKACEEALEFSDLIDKTVFCVENTASHAVCANDHGSPAISMNGDQKQLVGIFAWTADPEYGQLCNTKPAIFTNIAHYKNWIDYYVPKE